MNFEETYSIIIIAALIQSLFLGTALLFRKKGIRNAALLLGTLLIIHSFELLYIYLFHTGYLIKYPGLLGCRYPLTFLIGPLIYFLIKSITKTNWEFKKKDLLHLIPFIIITFISIPLFLKTPYEKQLIIINEIINHRQGLLAYHSLTIWEKLLSLVFELQPFLYLLYSAKLMFSFKHGVRQPKSKVYWFRIFTAYYLFVFLLGNVLSLINEPGLNSKISAVLSTLMGILFFGISYIVYNFPETLEEGQARKYGKSKLTDDKKKEYLAKLNEYLKSSKPYLNPELTLEKLSKSLSIPKIYLSQIINENHNENFNEFINRHRVELARNKLLSEDMDKYSIEGISNEVGFNSKASFYRAFKKVYGITPLELKKSDRENT